jgi:hypothetical protein
MPSISATYPPIEVRFRFSHENSQVESADTNKRESFWAPFLTRQRRFSFGEEITIEVFESRVRYGFSRELQRLFERKIGLEMRKRSLAGALLIQTVKIEYSSLIIDAIIEPADKLIKLFDGNFEIFERFLSIYALDAFDLALNRDGSSGYGVALSDIVGQMRVDINTGQKVWLDYRLETERSMSEKEGEKQAVSGNTTKSKANWLWVISNTSLVVPSLIICFFAWSAIKTVADRSKEVDSMYKDLVKEQKLLIDRELSHVQKLSSALDSTRISVKPK